MESLCGSQLSMQSWLFSRHKQLTPRQNFFRAISLWNKIDKHLTKPSDQNLFHEHFYPTSWYKLSFPTTLQFVLVWYFDCWTFWFNSAFLAVKILKRKSWYFSNVRSALHPSTFELKNVQCKNTQKPLCACANVSHSDNVGTSYLFPMQMHLIFLSLLHIVQLDAFHTSAHPQSLREKQPSLMPLQELLVWEHLGVCNIKKLLIKDR